MVSYIVASRVWLPSATAGSSGPKAIGVVGERVSSSSSGRNGTPRPQEELWKEILARHTGRDADSQVLGRTGSARGHGQAWEPSRASSPLLWEDRLPPIYKLERLIGLLS